MSIIYDFKAIRQDAAALGIRAIGEDDLPKAAVSGPSAECLASIPCPPAPAGVMSRGFMRGPVTAPSGSQAANGGLTNANQQAEVCPPPKLQFAPVTIQDLLLLNDADFAKLIDRIDPGLLKHIIGNDDGDDDI